MVQFANNTRLAVVLHLIYNKLSSTPVKPRWDMEGEKSFRECHLKHKSLMSADPPYLIL